MSFWTLHPSRGSRPVLGHWVAVPALPPTFLSISPNVGPASGGQGVTILGTNFVPGGTRPSVGGAYCGNVRVLSATMLQCTTPPHAAGSVTVQVETDGGIDGQGSAYAYVPWDAPVGYRPRDLSPLWTPAPPPAARRLFRVGATVGPISPATSTVTAQPSSCVVGGTMTLTLQAKDAAGNNLSTGGATVVFSHGGGTSDGTHGSVTDHGDGTYTGVFTGTVAGTATTFSATINGQPVTTAMPTGTVTVVDAYFNSATEPPGPYTLLTDDFARGWWYKADADYRTACGAVSACAGYYGSIYAPGGNGSSSPNPPCYGPTSPQDAISGPGVGGKTYCATSGYHTGSIGGVNMAKHGFYNNAQVTDIWARIYIQPQLDYSAGHEKFFELLANGGNSGTIMLGVYLDGGTSPSLLAINFLHMSPAYINNNPHPLNGWLEPNLTSQLHMTLGHWYYFEMHVILNTAGLFDGEFHAWLDDMGTDGVSGPGSPTKRWQWAPNDPVTGDHGLKWLNSGETYTYGGMWLENWANAPSVGTTFYDHLHYEEGGAGKFSGPIGFVVP